MCSCDLVCGLDVPKTSVQQQYCLARFCEVGLACVLHTPHSRTVVHSCTVTWGLLPHVAVFAVFAAVWKLRTVNSVDFDGRLAGPHDKLELS